MTPEDVPVEKKSAFSVCGGAGWKWRRGSGQGFPLRVGQKQQNIVAPSVNVAVFSGRGGWLQVQTLEALRAKTRHIHIKGVSSLTGSDFFFERFTKKVKKGQTFFSDSWRFFVANCRIFLQVYSWTPFFPPKLWSWSSEKTRRRGEDFLKCNAQVLQEGYFFSFFFFKFCT